MKRRIPLFAAILSHAFLIAAFIVPNNNYSVLAQQAAAVNAGSQIGGVAINLNIPKVDYLSPLESEFVAELNLARTQPQVYASFLEETRKFYTGNQLRLPGRSVETTAEGWTAVDEAIRFLRAARPLPALEVYRGMTMAAKDHSRDLGTSGNTGHRGSDGSTPNVRVGRYGDWLTSIGENIVYQATTTARESVMGLIVDDGIAGRGHRKNIFDPTYRAAGIALGERTRLGRLCVITFAGGFTERGASATQTGRPAARRF